MHRHRGSLRGLAGPLLLGIAGPTLLYGSSAALAPQGHQAPTPSHAGESREVAAGDLQLKGRQYSAAMDSFETALDKTPLNPGARRGEIAAATQWAADAVSAQQPDQAMTVLERAMRRVPDSPELLVSFGLEAIALQQFPIADQALHAADQLRPGDPTVLYATARLALEQQHMPEAERDLKAYLRVRPGDATAYFGLGHVYAMEQRPEEARTAFQRSVQLQPRQTESYYQLGELDLEAHRDRDATASFTKVLARDAHHAGALTGMGQIALRNRDYPRAEAYLAAAEQSDPTYAPPHYFRGLALAKLGRMDEAKVELARGDSRPHATAPPANSEDVQPATPDPQSAGGPS